MCAHPSARITCSIEYRFSVRAEISKHESGILEQYRATICLSRDYGGEPVRISEIVSPRMVGNVRFAVFKPGAFPGEPLPHAEPDVHSPLSEVWDGKRAMPCAWLRDWFPEMRNEFLVFAGIEVDEDVSGRRIGLAVMIDIINRFLSPGGIALLNPYPLEFLGLEFMPRHNVSREEIRAGIGGLVRHYATIGFSRAPTSGGLMALMRPGKPLPGVETDLTFSEQAFLVLRDAKDGDEFG